MQVVYAPDWSVGLNSRSSNSLMEPVMLSRLGSGLRGLYKDILDEPLPEFLVGFIRELDERERMAKPAFELPIDNSFSSGAPRGYRAGHPDHPGHRASLLESSDHEREGSG